MNNIKWETRNGEHIPVRALGTVHIMRILKCIEEEKIKFGSYEDLGYTADGDGDGIIYYWEDDENLAKMWKKILNNELDKRAREVI